ncbi:replication protein [Ammoniphilus sp. CFH 90114]|nr:replication protein [Ammoniphilus sp. CFH 90114]
MQNAQYHAWFHHHQCADGWITVAKKEKNVFKSYHYRPAELAPELSKWIGEDVYFSQNTFYKPLRRIEHIRQLRSLYVDVDCYLLNYDTDWVMGKLVHEFFGEIMPEPNLIIFSGRGIVLVWLIEPVPHQALPLWQAIQNYFCEQLKGIGGDTKALDAARVFRIAGSINSKTGTEVVVQYRHDYHYVLRDLQKEYLPDIPDNPNKKAKGRQKKVVQIYNIHRLYHARLLDLVKLCEIRNYDMKGYRETTLFLYRYWNCCFLGDPEDALNQTLSLNSEFKEPLSDKEVTRATRSAEKAWLLKNDKKADKLAKEKGYPGAGYNLKNETIIEWLDITEEEQLQLVSVIGNNVKRQRNTAAKREKRRTEGVKPRDEYLEAQQEKTEDKLLILQRAIEENPKVKRKDLANLLSVSIYRVDQLKHLLKSL